MTPCPLCGDPSAIPLFEKDGVPYERCGSCGLPTRGGPESPPSYHDYLPDATRSLPPITRERYETLLSGLARYRGGGRFLDVGCGGGFLVETARDLGWEAVGTEVSRAAVEFGRERGLDLRHGTLVDTGLEAGAFDVITLMEVVEHVPDPAGLLRQAAELLRPGGALYLTTPNWNSLSRRVLGAAWHPISRDHVVYLAPWSIRRALRAAGLRPVRVIKTVLRDASSLGWWCTRANPAAA